MDAQFREELINWGVDFYEVKERFAGNEDLVEKFMLKFLNDTSMERLENGLKSGDVEEAFQGSHALKGVAGNLSMAALLPDVKKLTEILRAKSLEGTDELYEEIKRKYDDLIVILEKYKQ